MKLIVAIELHGDIGEDEIVCGENSEKDEPITLSELRRIKAGHIIIIDEAELRKCDFDDSFYKFEYRGVEI